MRAQDYCEFDSEMVGNILDKVFRYGCKCGELESINKQLDAKIYELESKVDHLKTENAALRKKYEGGKQ